MFIAGRAHCHDWERDGIAAHDSAGYRPAASKHVRSGPNALAQATPSSSHEEGAMRLVTFVVSVFCSFGEQAQALLRSLSMRCGRSVPPTLIEESSWATPLFAPFARMSISLACRRALAAALRESVVSDPRRVAPAAPGPSDPSRSFQCACHAGVPV